MWTLHKSIVDPTNLMIDLLNLYENIEEIWTNYRPIISQKNNNNNGELSMQMKGECLIAYLIPIKEKDNQLSGMIGLICTHDMFQIFGDSRSKKFVNIRIILEGLFVSY